MTRHVLLIDDDADIRLVAHAALSRVAGWRVTEAEGGAQGVEAARADRPDVILLDLMMPGLDGARTLEMLRSHDDLRDVPVLLLTAKVGPTGEPPAVLDRVDGVVAKPFDPLALHAQVAALLGWRT